MTRRNVRFVRFAAVVVAVLALGACSHRDAVRSSATTEPASTTTTGVPRPPTWTDCRTGIAYRKAVADAGSRNPSLRGTALLTLRGLPVPAGHAEAWATTLTFATRFDEVASTIHAADQTEFDDAMVAALHDDPASVAFRSIDPTESAEMTALGADPPCDPAGLDADVGCSDPQACTQAWASAAHDHDRVALARLAQADIAGSTAPSTSLKELRCDQVGATNECHGGLIPEPGSSVLSVDYTVTWARMSDGRWYGIDAKAGRFQAVERAIG